MSHRISFIGRLTKDPESKFTPGGDQVTNITLAESKRVSKEKVPNCPNGWKESYNGKYWELTVFWRCAAWRGLAGVCNTYLQKGRQVYVKSAELSGVASGGFLNPRVWTGNDSVPHASYEITLLDIELIGNRDNGNGHSETVEDEPPPGYVETPDSGIPF